MGTALASRHGLPPACPARMRAQWGRLRGSMRAVWGGGISFLGVGLNARRGHWQFTGGPEDYVRCWETLPLRCIMALTRWADDRHSPLVDWTRSKRRNIPFAEVGEIARLCVHHVRCWWSLPLRRNIGMSQWAKRRHSRGLLELEGGVRVRNARMGRLGSTAAAYSCPSTTCRRLKRAHLLGLLGGPSHRSRKQAKQPPVFPGQFRKSGLCIVAGFFLWKLLIDCPRLDRRASTENWLFDTSGFASRWSRTANIPWQMPRLAH
jgi:hypothetical protein